MNIDKHLVHLKRFGLTRTQCIEFTLVVVAILGWGIAELWRGAMSAAAGRPSILFGYAVFVGLGVAFLTQQPRRTVREACCRFAYISVWTAVSLWPLAAGWIGLLLLDVLKPMDLVYDVTTTLVYAVMLKRNLKRVLNTDTV